MDITISTRHWAVLGRFAALLAATPGLGIVTAGLGDYFEPCEARLN